MMKIKSILELKKANTMHEGTYNVYVSANVLNYMIDTHYAFTILAHNDDLTLVRIYSWLYAY